MFHPQLQKYRMGSLLHQSIVTLVWKGAVKSQPEQNVMRQKNEVSVSGGFGREKKRRKKQ